MLIINNYDSYVFIKFNNYYKFNKIVIVNISVYSFYLLQLLDVKLYLFLKFAYGY